MSIAASDDSQLTNRPGASQILPTWSPDATRIAFASVTGSESEIFTIGSDGTGPRQLTKDPSGRPDDPVWSPDGSLIAFTSGGAARAVYVMNTDGGDQRRLTIPDAGLRINWPLLWSSDGARLAFASTGPNGQTALHVVGRDGTGLVDLTEGSGDNDAPAWSPDGAQLAFWSDREGGDLYSVPSTGGTPRRLTTGSRLAGSVSIAWSPDGQDLAVWNMPENQPGTIHLLDAAGGSLRSLIGDEGDDWPPLWRPHR